MSFNLTQPIDSELAANKANKIGDDFTNSATWRARMDVPVTMESRRHGSVGGLPGVAFDGSTSATRITSTLVGQNIAAGDFGLWVRFRVPSTSPSANPGLIAIGPNASDGGGNSSCRLGISSGSLVFTIVDSGGSSTTATIASFVTNFGGQVVDAVVTRKGSTLSIYINGTDTAYTGSPAASTSITSTYLNVGIAATGAATFGDRIYRAVLFNRWLSATDVVNLVTLGVDPADQWGSQTTVYSSTFSGGVDSWIQVAGTTIAGNATAPDASTAWLKIQRAAAAGTGLALTARNVTGVVAGKRYRGTATVYNENIAAVTNFTFGSAGFGPVAGTSTATVATASSAAIKGEFIAWDIGVRVGPAPSADGSNSDPAANVPEATSIWYVKNVTITRVGAVVDLDLSVGAGWFFPDRSTNELGGDGSGGISHQVPVHNGLITVVKALSHSDISASGGTTKLFDLPPNCGILRIEFDRVAAFDGGITLNIGTAGSANRYVSAQSVAGTGFVLAASASLASESRSASTAVYVQKSGATTIGSVTLRVTYEIRG